MNNVSRITSTLAAIAVTCLLSAGAAAAHTEPLAPDSASVPVVSPLASPQPDGLMRAPADQRAFQAHIEDELQEFAERDEALAESPLGHARGHAAVTTASPKSGTVTQPGSGKQSHDSGNGTGVAVIAITAVAGLALGVVGTTASRRLRSRHGLAA